MALSVPISPAPTGFKTRFSIFGCGCDTLRLSGIAGPLHFLYVFYGADKLDSHCRTAFDMHRFTMPSLLLSAFALYSYPRPNYHHQSFTQSHPLDSLSVVKPVSRPE